MINQYNSFFQTNREGWNKRTLVHKDSAFYDVAHFKAGKSSLNPVERAILGDVRGQSMLHLQCHFGLDSLSWAREGAQVTGVDFSDEAIRYANELSRELDIPANFVCCNVYDLPGELTGQFDIVFTSYGVIGWLPDLDAWASIVSRFLKPGGRFLLVEFHPVVWMMNDAFDTIQYHYHNQETIKTTNQGTYAATDANITYDEYGWNHSLAEVMTSLLKHGLEITAFEEYPYSCYNCFANMERGDDGYWHFKHVGRKAPLMYSLLANKK